MDPLKYGKLLHKMDNTYFIQLINKNLAIIDINNKVNSVKLFKDGELTLEWVDKYIDDITFIRDLGPKTFNFVNDEVRLITIKKSSKFIKLIKKAKKFNNNIITMDLETRLIDNKHSPYCICIYDGIIIRSFFINNYINKENMIISAMKYLSIRKYNNYKIYLHNFAKFDNIFLFKTLANLGIVSPIIHKGRFISMEFNYNNLQTSFIIFCLKQYKIHKLWNYISFSNNYLLNNISLIKIKKNNNRRII
uniref:DNA polymerase 2 n=1 Tax=Tricholoma terreum TaxID=76328 RepID=A0A6C0W3P1_9AGAR|nr:DNA polymerase 2 [Tricholoma terreum]QIC20237.1 DNA polymerase 2 [Tricholoma terreum]